MPDRFLLRAAALGCLLLLAGCRTYGAYDNEELSLEQIRLSNRVFAEDLALAQQLTRRISAEAGASPQAAELPARLDLLLTVHEAVLAEHRRLEAEAEEHAGDYRFLKRALGAIITEEEVVRDRYLALLDPEATVAPTRPQSAYPGDVTQQSLYHVLPPYYLQLVYGGGGLATLSASAGRAAASVPADTVGVAVPPADTVAAR